MSLQHFWGRNTQLLAKISLILASCQLFGDTVTWILWAMDKMYSWIYMRALADTIYKIYASIQTCTRWILRWLLGVTADTMHKMYTSASLWSEQDAYFYVYTGRMLMHFTHQYITCIVRHTQGNVLRRCIVSIFECIHQGINAIVVHKKNIWMYTKGTGWMRCNE